MKKVLPLVTVLAVLLALEGCKKTAENEALDIAKAFYSAVEQSNAQVAYDYLCDRSFLVKAPGGEEVYFAARPDFETYKVFFEKSPKIAVDSIEPRPDLSSEKDSILVFEITARPLSESVTLQSFLAYMGHNSKGEWSIMLPVPKPVSQPGVAKDTVKAP